MYLNYLIYSNYPINPMTYLPQPAHLPYIPHSLQLPQICLILLHAKNLAHSGSLCKPSSFWQILKTWLILAHSQNLALTALDIPTWLPIFEFRKPLAMMQELIKIRNVWIWPLSVELWIDWLMQM